MNRVDQWRADREDEIRADAERWGRGTVAAWSVRAGGAEVRRQVDDDAVTEALHLLGTVDKRRYVQSPEIREAIADAERAALVALQSMTDRTWSTFREDGR